MSKLSLFSPAKLNLFFRVLKKRPDGFHEIASLYQAIDLCDHLTFSFHEGSDTLICQDPLIPADGSNLVLRASALFRQKTGIRQFFSFHLEKRIPPQSGLGGGSGNAATTLWGLNYLMQTKIPDSILAAWGAELGSDVPFFFSQGRAFCEGRGEILTSIAQQQNLSLWVAKPKEGLSTPQVYQKMKLEILEQRDPKQALQAHLHGSGIYFNDLESGAFQLMPNLKNLKNMLQRLGFKDVHMTGSGTAFFCLGNIQNPNLPEIDFFPARFLHRSKESWYKFPL